MTCIVAITDGTVVTMGADSAGISGYSLVLRKDPKIYKVGEFLFGFTDSYRMGQLLGYKFTPPENLCSTIEEYMCTTFIDALRMVLGVGGYTTINNNSESAGTFLVGYRGRIFKICSDFQVEENVLPYNACGCGQDIALGSLYSSSDLLMMHGRVTIALEAAQALSAGVRAPFIICRI